MCLAYIITWRSKKGIGRTCKIQLELFEFYRYLEVVVGTCSASNLFQIDLKVHAFRPSLFFIYSSQFILTLLLLTILLLHTNSLQTLLSLYPSIVLHLLVKNFILTITNNTTHCQNFTEKYSFYTTILHYSYTFRI